MIFWFYFLVPYIGQWLTGVVAADSASARSRPRWSPSSCSRRRISPRSCAPASSRSRKGQPAAAQALGLTYGQTMRYVVLPQAFRNMLPVLLTQTIVLFQDTSLVYVLSITGFPRRGQQGRAARRPAGRDVSVRRRGLFRDFLSRVVRRPAPAGAHRHRPLVRSFMIEISHVDKWYVPTSRR